METPGARGTPGGTGAATGKEKTRRLRGSQISSLEKKKGGGREGNIETEGKESVIDRVAPAYPPKGAGLEGDIRRRKTTGGIA